MNLIRNCTSPSAVQPPVHDKNQHQGGYRPPPRGHHAPQSVEGTGAVVHRQLPAHDLIEAGEKGFRQTLRRAVHRALAQLADGAAHLGGSLVVHLRAAVCRGLQRDQGAAQAKTGAPRVALEAQYVAVRRVGVLQRECAAEARLEPGDRQHLHDLEMSRTGVGDRFATWNTGFEHFRAVERLPGFLRAGRQ